MKELAKQLINVWYDNGSVVVEQDGRLDKMDSLSYTNASNFMAAVLSRAHETDVKVYVEFNT